MRAAGAARRHESDRSDRRRIGRQLEERLVDAASPSVVAPAVPGSRQRAAVQHARTELAQRLHVLGRRVALVLVPARTRGARARGSTIIASRSHLASTLAAATEAHVRSALTRSAHARARARRPGRRRASKRSACAGRLSQSCDPSSSTTSTGPTHAGARAASARAPGEPQGRDDADLVDLRGARVPDGPRDPPAPQRGQQRRRAPRARAAWSRRRPSGRTAWSTSTTTTPTLTGPASAPRPTSSMPARSRAPSPQEHPLVAQVRRDARRRSPSVRRAGSRLVGHVRERAGRVAQQSACARAATPSRTPCRRRCRSGTNPPPGLPWL